MPHKLLLADDSVTIQRVIELTFADEDVTVTAVGDGQSAIDHIATDRPDIVLADVGMPARDGYEVAAFVKNDPALAHIPVLLLTGAFEPVDEPRASAVRCDGVLAKPFEPQLLIARVKELLGNGGESASSAASDPGAETEEVERDDDGSTARMAAHGAAGFTSDDFRIDTGTVADSLPVAPAADVSLDDYFDQLDAAFAHLSGAPAGQLKSAVTGLEDTSWAPSSSGAWSAADPAGLATPAPGTEARPSGSVSVAPPGIPPSPACVPVADAFAALLEAEQHGAVAPGAGEMTLPATAFSVQPVGDALVDAVVERLVQRFGGAASLHDVIVRVVSDTAERLVREELARLKAALK